MKDSILRNDFNKANLNDHQIELIESILLEFNQTFYIEQDPPEHKTNTHKTIPHTGSFKARSTKTH